LPAHKKYFKLTAIFIHLLKYKTLSSFHHLMAKY